MSNALLVKGSNRLIEQFLFGKEREIARSYSAFFGLDRDKHEVSRLYNAAQINICSIALWLKIFS